MSKLLWQGVETPETEESVDKSIMEFMAGEDVVLDRVLFPYDIRATAAHVRGLQRIGILSEADSDQLCALLEELRVEYADGRFQLDDRFEDGHSAIEIYLSEKAGDLGARVHTGRSRNDQVSVATRLYLLDQLGTISRHCVAIANASLEQAEAYATVPMPGYTHLQRAVPSSIGLWLAGFAEAFTDSILFAVSVMQILDASPLGTAAGYGVNLPLDRDGVAEDLGFSRLQVNPMAVQNSRGKFELMSLQAALHAMQDLRRLAWDLSLFTTSEFNFVVLPDSYTTGSSIMPNKRNPDVVELLRARAATVEGAIVEIQSLLSLPSGYQRDLQFTKGPAIRGLQAASQALAIVPALVRGMSFNQIEMKAAISAEMFATDIATEQAAKGVPFREAYRKAKQALGSMAEADVATSLAQRVSAGACGDLQLGRITARLRSITEGIPPRREAAS
ncbi:MAG TPA: argininosuccinate lyase [Xanthomonadales bacterium]|nr:argininosuccinate lyase [Xanthomonadales bacterium]